MSDWSVEEVEATVSDYLDMLALEVSGQSYSKTARRNSLKRLLRGRNDGAIERKHQNISAVLIDLGFAYISGYKPLRNYQQLLREVVTDRLARSPSLIDAVRRQVVQPAEVPAVDDILAALVDPPTPDTARAPYVSQTVRDRPAPLIAVDYLALEARNQSLGAAGEEFVRRFEVARLVRANQERLASRVEHVSLTRGDGLGFDILSFDESGRERLIEVKTTAFGASTPFYVSRGEVRRSRESADTYYIYRPFEFRRRPRLFWRAGPVDEAFRLEPSQFVATPR